MKYEVSLSRDTSQTLTTGTSASSSTCQACSRRPGSARAGSASRTKA